MSRADVDQRPRRLRLQVDQADQARQATTTCSARCSPAPTSTATSPIVGVWGKKFWWCTNNWVTEISGAYNPRDGEPAAQPRRPADAERARLRDFRYFGHRRQPGPLLLRRRLHVHAAGRELVSTTTSSPGFTTSRSRTCRSSSAPASSGRATARSTSPRSTTRRTPRPTATATSSRSSTRRRCRPTSGSTSSFTPTMSLQFYGQPLISTADYTDVRELARPKSLDFLGQGDPGAGSWTYDPATGRSIPTARAPRPPTPRTSTSSRCAGTPCSAGSTCRARRSSWCGRSSAPTRKTTSDFDFGDSMTRLADADADNIFLAKLT